MVSPQIAFRKNKIKKPDLIFSNNKNKNWENAINNRRWSFYFVLLIKFFFQKKSMKKQNQNFLKVWCLGALSLKEIILFQIFTRSIYNLKCLDILEKSKDEIIKYIHWIQMNFFFYEIMFRSIYKLSLDYYF